MALTKHITSKFSETHTNTESDNTVATKIVPCPQNIELQVTVPSQPQNLMTSSRHQSSDISEPKKKTVISETHESIEIEAASVERGVLASESCGNEPPVNDNIQVVVTQLEDSARVADTPKVDSPSKADNVVVPTSSMKFPSSDTSDNVEGDRTPAAF